MNVNRADELHERAMDKAEEAMIAQTRGDEAKSASMF